MTPRERLTYRLEASQAYQKQAVDKFARSEDGFKIILQCRAHQYEGGAKLEDALNDIFSSMVDSLIDTEILASNAVGESEEYYIELILRRSTEIFNIDTTA